MTRLLPVLALTVLGCGPGLDVVEVPLSGLPGAVLRVEPDAFRGGELVSLDLEQDGFHGPCHRLRAQTRLSANGQAFEAKSLGGATFTSSGFGGRQPACVLPQFTGAAFPDEPLTELLFSDGQTSRRALFQALRTPRRFQLNGGRQTPVRSGEEVDLEWFPETDQINGLEVALRAEGGTASVQLRSYRRSGNHLYVSFVPTPAGRYALTVSGTVRAGVEHCEGFTACEAPLLLPEDPRLSVDVTVVAP